MTRTTIETGLGSLAEVVSEHRGVVASKLELERLDDLTADSPEEYMGIPNVERPRAALHILTDMRGIGFIRKEAGPYSTSRNEALLISGTDTRLMANAVHVNLETEAEGVTLETAVAAARIAVRTVHFAGRRRKTTISNRRSYVSSGIFETTTDTLQIWARAKSPELGIETGFRNIGAVALRPMDFAIIPNEQSHRSDHSEATGVQMLQIIDLAATNLLRQPAVPNYEI